MSRIEQAQRQSDMFIEYERVRAPAWASAYIATHKRAAAVNFAVAS